MCAIVGVIANKNSHSLGQDIRQMTNRLTHREPDNEGYYIDQKREKGYAGFFELGRLFRY